MSMLHIKHYNLSKKMRYLSNAIQYIYLQKLWRSYIAPHSLLWQIQNNVFKCTHICICCYPLCQQEGLWVKFAFYHHSKTYNTLV